MRMRQLEACRAAMQRLTRCAYRRVPSDHFDRRRIEPARRQTRAATDGTSLTCRQLQRRTRPDCKGKEKDDPSPLRDMRTDASAVRLLNASSNISAHAYSLTRAD